MSEKYNKKTKKKNQKNQKNQKKRENQVKNKKKICINKTISTTTKPSRTLRRTLRRMERAYRFSVNPA